MELYDSFWPDNKAIADLTINVTRNPSGPLFKQQTYTQNLRGDHPVGRIVLQLEASDSDGVNIFMIKPYG